MTRRAATEDERERLAAMLTRVRTRTDRDERDVADGRDGGDEASPRAEEAGGEAPLLLPLLSELRRIRLETRRLQDEVAEARDELRSWTGRFGRRRGP